MNAVTSAAVPTDRLRVAAAQLSSVPGDPAANAAAAARYVDRSGDAGARLMVLPELFLPAYHPPTLAAEPHGCDLVADERGSIDDPRLEPLRAKARQRGIAVLAGAAVRTVAGRYIATVLIDPGGGVRDVYHKQQLCDTHEHQLFDPGEHGATVVLDGWRLGMGICYDATFPEHARAAALAGCHAYVTGGAFVLGGQQRVRLYHPARALDNTFYVVFAGAVGGPTPWTFCGGSAVYDPQGRALDRAPDSETGLAVADLSITELNRVRAEHTMLADRPTGPGDRRITTTAW